MVGRMNRKKKQDEKKKKMAIFMFVYAPQPQRVHMRRSNYTDEQTLCKYTQELPEPPVPLRTESEFSRNSPPPPPKKTSE